jgi:hypothetical protein
MKRIQKNFFTVIMETYLTLASTAKEKAATQLIMDCLESNGYQFESLLHHPNIQKLQVTHPEYFKLLSIFSSGTLQDLTSDLPILTPKQLLKLKQLTLISQAHRKEILYADLLSLLDIANIRELEDLIIQTIEQGLIFGRLDQKKACLYIESAIGRMNINIKEVLEQWYDNTGVVVQILEERIRACEEQVKAKQELDQKYQEGLKMAIDKKATA